MTRFIVCLFLVAASAWPASVEVRAQGMSVPGISAPRGRDRERLKKRPALPPFESSSKYRKGQRLFRQLIDFVNWSSDRLNRI